MSTILLALGINSGLGAHSHQLSNADVSSALKWSWTNQILGIFATALGKLAVVAFLQQIHGPEQRRRIGCLWGLAMCNLVINIITIAVIVTQCSPRARLWNHALPGTCDGRRRNQITAYVQGSAYPV